MTDAERLAEIRSAYRAPRSLRCQRWLLAQIDALLEDVATLKRVLLSDEDQLRQWEQRTRELQADLMRTVRERDDARDELTALMEDRAIRAERDALGARVRELETANVEREQFEYAAIREHLAVAQADVSSAVTLLRAAIHGGALLCACTRPYARTCWYCLVRAFLDRIEEQP